MNVKRGYLACEPPSDSISLFVVVGVVTAMVVCLFTIATAAMFSMRSWKSPPDPFAVYRSVLPGQTSDHVEEQGFDCFLHDTTSEVVKQCWLRPALGKIASIKLVVYDGIVEGAIFNLHEGEFIVGDAMLVLGIPLRTRHLPFTSSWDVENYHIVVSTYHRHFSYFVPIRAIQLWTRSAA